MGRKSRKTETAKEQKCGGTLALDKGSLLESKGMLLAVILSAFVVFLAWLGMDVLIVIPMLLAMIFIVKKHRDWAEFFTLPVILTSLYILYCGVSGIWAQSGKFFLKEYNKLLFGFCIYLILLIRTRHTDKGVRGVAAWISGISAIYAFLSVESATTGLFMRLCSMFGISVNAGFEVNTRLTGIFGNANELAGVLALGVLLSIFLLDSAEGSKQKAVACILLGTNAYAFLLSFSMGGTAIFFLSVLVYLAFAGNRRVAVLIHMLCTAVPTLLCAFLAFPFFNRGGVVQAIPLAIWVLDLCIIWALEKFVANWAVGRLTQNAKSALYLLVGVGVVLVAYLVVAVNLTGAFTFTQDGLRRSAYPAAGKHELVINSDAPVQVTVTSQNMAEVMMHKNTQLYSGDAANAAFEVPKDSKVVYFDFAAQPGTTLTAASIDGANEIKLKYKLLPGFISNRLQGLFANQNAIQRTVFFDDGLKIFAKYPILGNGMGAFESAVYSVQSFYYQTKYVHNNYIQVLLDAGIVGFVLYVGMLLANLWVLWKNRRRHQEDKKYSAIFPALFACFIMICGHSMVEVSLSAVPVIVAAYAIFALIAFCYGTDTKMPAAKFVKPARRTVSVFGVVYLVLIIANTAAGYLSASSTSDINEFLSNQKMAATIGWFDRNDFKASYIVAAADMQDNASLRNQADIYAQQLSTVRSNSLSEQLVQYYLKTGRYKTACAIALNGVQYTASQSESWNRMFSMFNTWLIPSSESGMLLVGEDRDILETGLFKLYDSLQEHNKNSMEQITLDEQNQMLVDLLTMLKE